MVRNFLVRLSDWIELNREDRLFGAFGMTGASLLAQLVEKESVGSEAFCWSIHGKTRFANSLPASIPT